MGEIGLPELLVILVIALVVFGGKRLPEIARAMGQAIHAFKKGLQSEEQAGEEQKPHTATPSDPHRPAV